jgi:PKD repeat protein
VSDAQHSGAQLSYQWQTILHHNNHIHPESATTAQTGSTVVSGEGCYTDDFRYEIKLTVTDAGGLGTTVAHWLFPRCSSLPPTALITSNLNYGEGPLAVSLSGSGSSDNRPIPTFTWDFGDGTGASGMNVNKTFTEQGSFVVTLTVVDEDGLQAYATKVITVIGYEVPQCVGSTGSLLRQYWSNVDGSLVTDLTSAASYPNAPSGTTYPTSFQAPTDFANNYGTRIRGYIIAPSTGNYVFTVVSDDASEVYLSLNADPVYKRSICLVPGWTNVGEFTKYPSQTSVTIPLVAGRYYYVEVLHKEGSGGDHLALYWQTPTNGTRTIIPGSALARWQDCSPSVVIRAELQGAFNAANNLMRDDLRAAGLIPTIEPFTALGFTHAGGGGGETVSPAMLSNTGMNAVVDWVLIELRNKNSPSTIVATRSAFIQRDGDVVGTNGSTRILFNVAADNYYVALRHRNHLGVMTATSVPFSASATSVDLTSPGAATHGISARSTLTPSRMGLWSGNTYRDGQVKYTGSNNDRDPVLVQVGSTTPNNQANGYSVSDINLDGLVRYTGSSNDRDLILQIVGGTTPNNSRVEQLP